MGILFLYLVVQRYYYSVTGLDHLCLHTCKREVMCFLGNDWVDVIGLPFLFQNRLTLWLQCMSGSKTVNILSCVQVVVGLPVAAFACCQSHV